MALSYSAHIYTLLYHILQKWLLSYNKTRLHGDSWWLSPFFLLNIPEGRKSKRDIASKEWPFSHLHFLNNVVEMFANVSFINHQALSKTSSISQSGHYCDIKSFHNIPELLRMMGLAWLHWDALRGISSAVMRYEVCLWWIWYYSCQWPRTTLTILTSRVILFFLRFKGTQAKHY